MERLEERSSHRISQLLSSLALPHYQRVGQARAEVFLEGIDEGVAESLLKNLCNAYLKNRLVFFWLIYSE